MTGTARRRTAVALACAVAALSLLVVRSWRIDYDYSIDFQAYWLAGGRILAGEAERLYAPGGGPAEGTPRALPAAEFKNMPLVAVGFAPLAEFDYLTAKRIFWWIGLAALLATALVVGLWILPASLGPPMTRVAAAVALVACFAPAQTALRHGQTTPLVTLLVTGYLAAALQRKRLAAGLLLAAAAIIKWPAWLLAVSDALHRRRHVLAAFLAGVVLLTGASVALFGMPLHDEYMSEVRSHAGTVMTGHNNQSVAAVLTRLSGPVPAHDWTPRPLSNGVQVGTVLVTLGLLAAVLLALLPRRSGPPLDAGTSRLLEFPAVTALGIVILPVAWDHYFLLLAPALAALAMGLHARRLLGRPAVLAGLVLAAGALALPTPQLFLEEFGRFGWPGALIVSHYFLGALLVIGLAGLGLRAAPVTRTETT